MCQCAQAGAHLHPGDRCVSWALELSFQQTPGVHGNQATDYPAEHKQPETQADRMVPILEALVWNPTPVGTPLQLLQTDIDAGKCQEGSQQRGPDHDLAPQPAPRTQ